jgi:hypothetical protein
MHRLSISFVDWQLPVCLYSSDLGDVSLGLFGTCDKRKEVGEVGAKGICLVDLEEKERLCLLRKTKPRALLAHSPTIVTSWDVQDVTLNVRKA